MADKDSERSRKDTSSRHPSRDSSAESHVCCRCAPPTTGGVRKPMVKDFPKKRCPPLYREMERLEELMKTTPEAFDRKLVKSRKKDRRTFRELLSKELQPTVTQAEKDKLLLRAFPWFRCELEKKLERHMDDYRKLLEADKSNSDNSLSSDDSDLEVEYWGHHDTLETEDIHDTSESEDITTHQKLRTSATHRNLGTSKTHQTLINLNPHL